MLILTRKTDQEVLFIMDNGETGVIRIVGQSEGRVRLGIEFPQCVTVLRSELLERKEAAQ